METYTLSVNGSAHVVEGALLRENLLHVLRERLGLWGSKGACEQGECGSCSIVMDGDLVCACCVLAADAVGTRIVTIEGLERQADGLNEVQRAFVEEGAVQCGFCTPGLVVAIHHLLERVDDPSPMEVREAISGNLCRCTGYGRIVAAAERAAQERADG
jgi:carbon-monoxide dehydrogenase small subunit